MWKLFKAELAYNKWYLLLIVLMPIGFALGMQFGFKPLTGVDFFEKYTWSILVGMGSYIFIFIMWQTRHGEKRNRQQMTLPLALRKIALARMIFGIFPFVIILVIIYMTWLLVGESIEIHMFRILAQLGMMFAALAFIQLMLDVRSLNTRMKPSSWFLIVGSIGCITVFVSMFAVFEVIIPVYRTIFGKGEEFMFYLWGLILLVISNFVFMRRSTFLN